MAKSSRAIVLQTLEDLQLNSSSQFKDYQNQCEELFNQRKSWLLVSTHCQNVMIVSKLILAIICLQTKQRSLLPYFFLMICCDATMLLVNFYLLYLLNSSTLQSSKANHELKWYPKLSLLHSILKQNNCMRLCYLVEYCLQIGLIAYGGVYLYKSERTSSLCYIVVILFVAYGSLKTVWTLYLIATQILRNRFYQKLQINDTKIAASLGKTCPICLDDISTAATMLALNCNKSHLYHLQCIFEWLVLSNTCPVCRETVIQN